MEDVHHLIEKQIAPVSRETWAELEMFEALFRKWAKAINLAAPAAVEDLWCRHILDSAQLLPLGRGAIRWTDLGSGGGFPGIVLAVLLKPNPAASIELIESNRKKAAFLQTAIAELNLPARVHACRIEAVAPELGTPDIVTARALAPLTRLLELTERWLSTSSTALFHKGRDYRHEIDESTERWVFDLVEHRSVVAHDSVILEVSNLRRRS